MKIMRFTDRPGRLYRLVPLGGLDRLASILRCATKTSTGCFFISTILLLYGCNNRGQVNTGWSDSIAVETMVISDGTTPAERNYVGAIGSEQTISLSAPLAGKLTKVLARNGQQVSRGQLLFVFDTTTASSMHATALATLKQAEDAHRRLRAIYQEGGISDVKWIEMETNLEKARQTEVSTRKQVNDCLIRAPFGGVLSCGTIETGQELKPGEPFCRVLDLNRLRVEFSVPEQDISMISVGDTATAVVPAIGDGTIKVCINNKSLVANPLGHTYKVYATIETGETRDMLPDMVAKVHIKLNATGGIVVPASCVQTMPEGSIVWAVRNGRSEHRLISTGDFVRNGVSVTAGLAAGDTVVIAGQEKLYTGAKIKAANDMNGER